MTKTWAVCDCGKEMVPNGGCTLDHIKTPQGNFIPRIPNGEEMRFGSMDANTCHDCNAAVGAIHHINCDWEECPICHGQAFGCEHIESFVELEDHKPQTKGTPYVKVENGQIQVIKYLETIGSGDEEIEYFTANKAGATKARKVLDKLSEGKGWMCSSSVDFPTEYGGTAAISAILHPGSIWLDPKPQKKEKGK